MSSRRKTFRHVAARLALLSLVFDAMPPSYAAPIAVNRTIISNASFGEARIEVRDDGVLRWIEHVAPTRVTTPTALFNHTTPAPVNFLASVRDDRPRFVTRTRVIGNDAPEPSIAPAADFTEDVLEQIKIRLRNIAATGGIGCDAANVNSGGASNCPLVAASSVEYIGAFRWPSGSSNGFIPAFGPTVIAYDPADGGLYGAGIKLYENGYSQTVVKVSIPTLVNSSTVASLNFGSYTQGAVNEAALEGHLADCDAGTGGNCSITGMAVYNSRLYMNILYYFDSSNLQRKSVASRPLTLSTTGDVKGLKELYFDGDTLLGASLHNYPHWMAGWMGVVPTEWQTALGGDLYTGVGNQTNLFNGSYGNTTATFTAAGIASGTNPLTANLLVGFPGSHRTEGRWQTTSTPASGAEFDPVFTSTNSGAPDTIWFGMGSGTGGCVIVAGSRSQWCFGKRGEGDCYGRPTTNPALHRTITEDMTDLYCYELEYGGAHLPSGYPYHWQIQGTDLSCLAEVKAGTKSPWQCTPYEVADITTPFPVDITTGRSFGAPAYDCVHQIAYVPQLQADTDGASRSLILAFRFNGAAACSS